jgi:aldehyde:ferredoxin oxidoreductase
MARMVMTVTGWNFAAKELLRAGARIYTIERLLAVRDGISRKDDNLPPRILNEALPRGPSRGIRFGRENLDRMLDEYYALRGWDREGRPTKAKLKELGIPKLFER